jgi:hypothetical protein
MLKINSKNRFSFIVMIFIFGIIIFFNLMNPPGNILSWDFFGYYLYLPFTFIYHDLGLKNIDVVHQIIDEYNNTSSFYQAFQSPNGLTVMKYPMGISILNAPFFFIGHLWAKIGSYPTDGFSEPYQKAIFEGAIFYTLLGVYFLRKVLLKFFDEKVTILVMIIVIFGTNYFFHTSFDGTGAMPHNYEFTLYTLILWFTIRWHEEFKLKYALALGIAMGLAIICRASEVICFIIPALWGIYNKETLIQKLEEIKKNYKQVALIIIIVGIVLLPQLLYWKHYTGKYLFNSYGNNAGEGFEFFHPFILELLFSFRKGWFIYTPIMIFAVIGLINLYKKNKEIFWSVFVFFIINIYIVGSWSCWWYAESFSQRSLIQSYPLMALPLGYFITAFLSSKSFVRILIPIVFGILIIFNLFQTLQYKKGIIHGSRMTKDYYMAIFGKTSFDPSFDKLLLVNRSFDGSESFNNESDFNKKNIGILDFENTGDKKNICDTLSHSGHKSFIIDSTCEFSPGISITYENITSKPYAWIHATVYIYTSVPFNENPASLVITFEHKGFGYKYNAFDLSKYKIELNKWNKISVDYLTPEVRRTSDVLKVYIWHQGKKKFYISDLNVDAYEPSNSN